MKVTLTRVTQKPVMAIEEAASNCYDSTPSPDGRIMNACYESGHQSVLEFADFTFHVELISRACSHQTVRHREASYAQRSQRYVEEDNFQYITPPTIQMNAEALIKFIEHMANCRKVYNELIDLGIPAEDARYTLPEACATIIEVKVNGRELIHIANERLCKRAQWEIRDMVKAMKQSFDKYMNA
jgi:thymidylate synthase (FAD)